MVDERTLLQGLVQRGLPPHVAQGFVMNMRDESGLNPGINEIAPLVPGSRGGFGLYQLTGPRRTAYERFAGERGVSPDNVDAQLDFLMSELQGPEQRAAQSIFAAQDAPSAAVAIARDFLRPAPENLQKRIARYTGGATMQPQGLLSDPSIQPRGQGQPERLPFFQRPETKDFLASVAIGLGGLTMNPNQAIIQAAQQDIADRRKTREATEQRNSTLDYLRSLKTPQAQEAIRYAEGTGDITGALRMATAQPEQTSLMQNVQWLMSQGIPMDEALQIVRSGAVVNVGAQGEPRPELLGTQGLVAIPDPSVPEGYRVVPAPGSPIAVEREKERAKLASAEEAKGTGRARAANVVIQDIKRFRDLVENAPWYDPATGFGARTLSDVGGTTAANAAELSETIRANIGFDRLQQMREESPTGGALGQVAVQELQALQSVLGSLSQAQTREQLVFNLDRLDEIYTEIVRKASAYPNAGKFGFGTDGAPPSGGGTTRLRYNATTGQMEPVND